jgi:hypothetical protein
MKVWHLNDTASQLHLETVGEFYSKKYIATHIIFDKGEHLEGWVKIEMIIYSIMIT